MAWFIPLIIGLVLTAISYAIMPKPKTASQKTIVQDLQAPTAEAGRPLPKLFGDKIIKDVNVLWYGEKRVHRHKVD